MADGLPCLRVIRTLGGCGGTLVSRLFGALPKTVVLSETNPRSASLFGFTLNPLRQLRRWHPELLEHVSEFDDAEIGDPDRFGQMLQGVAAAAAQYGRRLILRDFNYADFVGAPFVWPYCANSSLDRAIAERFDARSLLLVRHPADQLVSLRTHRALARVLTAQRFVDGGLAFLDAFDGAPLFRYEALVDAPEPVFRAMCTALDVAPDAAALDRFSQVETVTGSLARAAEDRIVAAPPLPGASEARQELGVAAGYSRLLDRLGYLA